MSRKTRPLAISRVDEQGEEEAAGQVPEKHPLRDRIDIKLFVGTDADIRIFRRIRRDTEHRGCTFDSARERHQAAQNRLPIFWQSALDSKRSLCSVG